MIAAGISLMLLWLDVRDAPAEAGRIKDTTPDAWWNLGQDSLTR